MIVNKAFITDPGATRRPIRSRMRQVRAHANNPAKTDRTRATTLPRRSERCKAICKTRSLSLSPVLLISAQTFDWIKNLLAPPAGTLSDRMRFRLTESRRPR
jgi:hypothetical protein